MQFSYFKVLLLGLGFMGISLLWGIYNAYVPVFLQAGRPDYSSHAGVKGYGLGTALTGFIMTLDNMAALLILPYVGALSDRIRTRWGRRKPFIAVGAPLAALGFISIPFGLGSPLPLFMLTLMLTLVSMDVFRTPVIALMPDITPSPKRSQANGAIVLMGGLGGVLAFAVGGQLFKKSIAAPFLFGGLAMLLGCCLVLAFIREPPPAEVEPSEPGAEEPRLLDSLRQVLMDQDRSALRLLAAIFAWFLSFSALEVFFTSFAVNELRVNSGEATFLLTFLSVALLASAAPSGLIGARCGRKQTVLAGIVAFALVLMCGYFVETLGQVRIVLVLAGLAWSLILVNSLPMVMDCAPPQRVGAYTGMYYLASQSSSVLSPILTGQTIAAFHNNYRMMFLYGAAALVVAFALMWGVRRGEAVRAAG